MAKQTRLPRYSDFFSVAEGAFTGWLASHPRSLLTGGNSSVAAADAKQAGSVFAGGDEPGQRGKVQKSSNARCDLLNDSLRAARMEASQAKVDRDNWELQAESHGRKLDRLNARLNAIFRRLEQIDRELAERQSSFAPDPAADARNPPRQKGSWFKEVLRTTGTQLVLTMLSDFLSRMEAEGKKSAHADRTRELIEERRVVQEDWNHAEGKRREQDEKYRVLAKRVDEIEKHMVSLGCPTSQAVQG